MIKKILGFLALSAFGVFLFLVIASFLLSSDSVNVNKEEKPKMPAIGSENGSYEIFNFIPEEEFQVKVYRNGKLLGTYIQKGDAYRIDSPDKKYSLFYVAGAKKLFLLDHERKAANQIFNNEELPFYFDFYSLFLIFEDFKFRKKNDLYVAEKGSLKAELRVTKDRRWFEEGIIYDKKKGIAKEKITLKYEKTARIDERLFYVSEDYSIGYSY
jgi:hypothetical protein